MVRAVAGLVAAAKAAVAAPADAADQQETGVVGAGRSAPARGIVVVVVVVVVVAAAVAVAAVVAVAAAVVVVVVVVAAAAVVVAMVVVALDAQVAADVVASLRGAAQTDGGAGQICETPPAGNVPAPAVAAWAAGALPTTWATAGPEEEAAGVEAGGSLAHAAAPPLADHALAVAGARAAAAVAVLAAAVAQRCSLHLR